MEERQELQFDEPASNGGREEQKSGSSGLVKKIFLSVVRKFRSSRSGTSCLVSSSNLRLGVARENLLYIVDVPDKFVKDFLSSERERGFISAFKEEDV
uniref:Uncharacterized protein n=1 Tax=Oryza sativa subsp. japonica TaxID=39947 RepID=Q69QC2_ORYSJ|nr:hypothetical protein [Oryza sativa Japonica Group]